MIKRKRNDLMADMNGDKRERASKVCIYSSHFILSLVVWSTKCSFFCFYLPFNYRHKL